MKKSFWILALAFILIIGGCGKKSDNKDEGKKTMSQVSDEAITTGNSAITGEALTACIDGLNRATLLADSVKKQIIEQQEAREREQQEVREREQQEAREKEQQEAREKEQQEAREREQQEAREKEQQEAREKEQQENGQANAEVNHELSAPLVVIDAGHQQRGNSSKEPVGPGASETKAKVTGGTSGVVTGLPEYQLNLDVAFKLQAELESRGYRVIMVRTSNDVDISNSERAAVANNAGADAFIRIHANSIDNSSRSGAMTICQTSSNPYNASIYSRSKALSSCVLDSIVVATGCRRERVWETDTMSGINWCQVPVTIVEMGYMSNPTEDQLLASEDYQYKMANGIANGIDAFFGR